MEKRRGDGERGEGRGEGAEGRDVGVGVSYCMFDIGLRRLFFQDIYWSFVFLMLTWTTGLGCRWCGDAVMRCFGGLVVWRLVSGVLLFVNPCGEVCAASLGSLVWARWSGLVGVGK